MTERVRFNVTSFLVLKNLTNASSIINHTASVTHVTILSVQHGFTLSVQVRVIPKGLFILL